MLHKRRIANLTFILLSIFIFLFTSCDFNNTEKKVGVSDNNPEDSIARNFYANGNLSSVIGFKNGQQHGDSKYYYSNGNLKYEVVFQNGRENGKARHYYQNGDIYQIVPYKNGIINGVREKYYKNGALMAEIPYVENYQYFGIQEYAQSGNKIEDYPKIIIQTDDNTAFTNTYTITLQLSKHRSSTQFYFDKFLYVETLKNHTYNRDLNVRKNDYYLSNSGFIPVFTEDGKAIITINLQKGGYIMKEVNFACSFITSRNNLYWVFETFNLSVENRY